MLRPDRGERLPDLTPAFELLRRHGSAQATVRPPAFGPPVAPALTPGANTPLDPLSPDSGDAQADSANAGMASRPETKDGFSRTGSPRLPMKRNWVPLALAGAVVVGGVGIGAIALRGFGDEEVPTPDSSVELTSGSESELSPVVSPPQAPPPAALAPSTADADAGAKEPAVKKPRRPVAAAKPRPKPGPKPPSSAAPAQRPRRQRPSCRATSLARRRFDANRHARCASGFWGRPAGNLAVNAGQGGWL